MDPRSIPAPAQPLPPLATIHAQGFGARQVEPGVAEIVMGNPAFQTVARVTRDELDALVGQLTALLEQLGGAGPKLVTPHAAGQLVIPGK